MIDKTVFSKVRKVQIKTSKMVTEIFSGEYRSVFKGRGMEFEEVREYQPGDEIRSIDWNVTARMNKPFIKVFSEERELTVIFLVDISSSMLLGTKVQNKRELVAELCAVLAFTAIHNKDKVGVILFSDKIEKYIPPAKGKKHVLRVIRELIAFGKEKAETNKKTDINMALEYLNKVIRKKSVCFLVSDFFSLGYEKLIAITSKKHDLIAVHIMDKIEKEFNEKAFVVFKDLETSSELIADFTSNERGLNYRKIIENRENTIKKQFNSNGIDYFTLQTDDDYLKKLTAFFKTREKRIKRR